MKIPSTLLISLLPTLSRADLTFHDPISEPKPKRELLTCEQTYGGGSITCGDRTSRFCYDPTKGEVCCLLDNGYCKAGDFCAPVTGFCCHNGEDPLSCANRLDFTIPASGSSTALPGNALSSSTIPTDPIQSETVPTATSATPFLVSAASSSSINPPASDIPSESAIPILAATSSVPLTPAFSSILSAQSIPASATGISLHPEFTAPANSNGTQSNGTAVTSAAVSKRGLRGDEVIGWGFIFVGVVVLGMAFIV